MVEVNFKPPPNLVGTPAAKLMLVGYTPGTGFDCKINKDAIFNFILADHSIANHFLLSCNMTTEQSAQVYINTNYNGEAIGPYLVASKTYDELSQRVKDLQKTVEQLQQGLPTGIKRFNGEPGHPRKNDNGTINDTVWESKCVEPGTTVISGTCIAHSGVPLQNVGPEYSKNQWECAWMGHMPGADVVATCVK